MGTAMYLANAEYFHGRGHAGEFGAHVGHIHQKPGDHHEKM